MVSFIGDDNVKENFYLNVLNNINDLVVVKNKNGNIVYSNNEVHKVLKEGKNDIFLDRTSNKFYQRKLSSTIDYVIEIFTDVTKYVNLINYYSTDCLTKLPLRSKLDEYFSYIANDESVYAYALIDIDNFKHVNDEYGHVVGDEVLIKIASILSESIEEDDFVCRYGGEEFLYITKFDSILNVINKFNNIRKSVSQSIFKVGDTSFSVTISTGVSLNNNDDINQNIHLADRNLYYVKNHGKNNVFLTDDIKKQSVKSVNSL